MALPPGRVLVVRDGILCRPNQGRTAEYNAVHGTVNATGTGRKTSGPTPFGVDPLRESASMAAITPADYILSDSYY